MPSSLLWTQLKRGYGPPSGGAGRLGSRLEITDLNSGWIFATIILPCFLDGRVVSLVEIQKQSLQIENVEAEGRRE